MQTQYFRNKLCGAWLMHKKLKIKIKTWESRRLSSSSVDELPVHKGKFTMEEDFKDIEPFMRSQKLIRMLRFYIENKGNKYQKKQRTIDDENHYLYANNSSKQI